MNISTIDQTGDSNFSRNNQLRDSNTQMKIKPEISMIAILGKLVITMQQVSNWN
jgi:hypothetical protein